MISKRPEIGYKKNRGGFLRERREKEERERERGRRRGGGGASDLSRGGHWIYSRT